MNSFLKKHISLFLSLFIIIQPILDVITAISIKKFNYNLTIGSITRLAFLAFCIIYLLFLNTQNRKRNVLMLGIFFTYFIIYCCLTLNIKDFSVLFYEIKNFLNTFYLPIVLLSLYEMFKQYNIEFNYKTIMKVYLIYIVLIIVPDITHTGFLSYSHSKLGTVGWFMSANAIGNILSILLPLILFYLFKVSKNLFLTLLIIIPTLWIFTNIGTKTPIIALGMIIFINLIYYYICNIKQKKYHLIVIVTSGIIAIILSIMLILPKTSFYKNLEIHRKYLKINSYSEIFTSYDNVNNFIFSERLTFLHNSYKSYKKASLLEKTFGIGYIENYKTKNESTKTVEIDYFDILFRHGVFVFILYFSILVYFLYKCFEKIIKNKDLLHLEYLTSIFLILILAFFSGHILITPSVSIYISLIICLILHGFKIDKNINI